MPTYEYLCKKCGHYLEAFQKISEAPLTECPKCHQPSLSKQISATHFQLKGTGWYVTDIRDKGKPKPAESTDGEKVAAATKDGEKVTATKDGEKVTATNHNKGNTDNKKEAKPNNKKEDQS